MTIEELKAEAIKKFQEEIIKWRESSESCFEANLYLPNKLEALKNIVAHHEASMMHRFQDCIDFIFDKVK